MLQIDTIRNVKVSHPKRAPFGRSGQTSGRSGHDRAQRLHRWKPHGSTNPPQKITTIHSGSMIHTSNYDRNSKDLTKNDALGPILRGAFERARFR